jgi:hypothetical protein
MLEDLSVARRHTFNVFSSLGVFCFPTFHIIVPCKGPHLLLISQSKFGLILTCCEYLIIFQASPPHANLHEII